MEKNQQNHKINKNAEFMMLNSKKCRSYNVTFVSHRMVGDFGAMVESNPILAVGQSMLQFERMLLHFA